MATPFENFVNTELPKRLHVELPPSGNLPAGKLIVTTGVGLQVETSLLTPIGPESGTSVIRGDWDASTGVYPLVQSDGALYRVSVAGSVGPYSYKVDDYLIFWQSNPYKLLGRNGLDPVVALQDAAVFFIDIEANTSHKHTAYITRLQAQQLVSGSAASITVTTTDATAGPVHTHNLTITYVAGQLVVAIGSNHSGDLHDYHIVGDGTGATIAPGTVTIKNIWNAATNAYPVSGVDGDLYRVTVAGTISGQQYAIDDMFYYHSGSWHFIAGPNAVTTSVGVTWIEINTNYTAVAGNHLLVDTSLNTVDVTLPASPSVSDVVVVAPSKPSYEINRLRILRNGQLIAGSANDVDIVQNGKSIQFIYAGPVTGWVPLNYGDTLVHYEIFESGSSVYIALTDSGIGHTHYAVLSDITVRDLISGTIPSATVASSTIASHSHLVTVEYSNGSLIVTNVASNHVGTPHGAKFVTFGGISGNWIFYDGVAITSPFSVNVNQKVNADTRTAALTVVLPLTPDIGDSVIISPAFPSFNTNALTVMRNGHLLNGQAQDVIIDENITIEFIYSGGTIGWSVAERS